MASSLSENLACINGVDHDHDNVLKHSSFFLMSLMEETQGDQSHYNDQELHNMIRSLEAEINPNPNTMEEEDHDFTLESRLLIDDVQFMDVHDCSDSINGLDLAFAWDDDHMEQVSSSSPSNDLNLFMDFYGNDDMVEFGAAVDDQYSLLHYYGVSLDLEDHSYSSVWHETLNDRMIYY